MYQILDVLVLITLKFLFLLNVQLIHSRSHIIIQIIQIIYSTYILEVYILRAS